MENELVRIIKLTIKENVEGLSDRHTVSVNFMERILAKMRADEETVEILRNHIDRLREHIAIIGKNK